MPTTSSNNSLWQFIDQDGTFRSENPDRVSRLYFPLGNDAGLYSSITPTLHGDIKTGQNSFLTQPVSVEDLHNTKSNRNFWVYVDGKGSSGKGVAWSLAGVSAWQRAQRLSGKSDESSVLEAGILWHKVTRENNSLKLRSEIVNFAPAGPDKVELMLVTLTNTGASKIRVTPTGAIPIFARSADNLRDHSHVTSLLHRIIPNESGVVVKPTMSFDERGHKVNHLSYGVLGFQEGGEKPTHLIPTVAEFIGEGGDLESPLCVIEHRDIQPSDPSTIQGKSAMGGLRFKTQTLFPGKKIRFILILGVADNDKQWDVWATKYGSVAKAEAALQETKIFWKNRLSSLRFYGPDETFNGWARWVVLQPTLRKIFGCSFLPDFDYGRGGRGWRDLWQDCLALLLTTANETRPMLLHNFNGIRIDGSNATIIGNGEFVADRNNITRVWMDHGLWPFLTLELYIHQTGDLNILFENAHYFRDRQFSRAQHKDAAWNEAYGRLLKTKTGAKAEGSILEHLLVQHCVQFFNVGDHNHIKLENADWNDGLDMAYEKGESVAFSAMYAANLKQLAELIEKAAALKGFKRISLAKELLLLLDRIKGPKVNYYVTRDKRRRLEKYFAAVQPVVSGIKVDVPVTKLTADLRAKADSLIDNIRKKEWLQTRSGDGLYNGYYDNHGRRVEGDSSHGLRMTLAGQVFPIMGGVATPEQIGDIFKSSKKFLKDKEHGGFRLNTDFHEIRPDLGRAFSFSYGDKENGAFFSHMNVMFANALYRRGFVNEGFEVLDSIYRMCVRTQKSRIFPGIPEYFNSEGRGLYHYLTGSASWMVLTLLTQVYGVRGSYGNLLLQPKLTRAQFGHKNEVSVDITFADIDLSIVYRNSKKLNYGQYCISRLRLNGKELKDVELNQPSALVLRTTLQSMTKRGRNLLTVDLE